MYPVLRLDFEAVNVLTPDKWVSHNCQDLYNSFDILRVYFYGLINKCHWVTIQTWFSQNWNSLQSLSFCHLSFRELHRFQMKMFFSAKIHFIVS